MSTEPPQDPHRPSEAATTEECELDWLEALALELVRWICDSYVRPAQSGWETAITRAEAVLGLEDGPRFYAAVVAVMAALRRGRRSGFTYSRPYCPICSSKVLLHEQALLRVIRAGRRDDRQGIDGHAVLLLEGNEPAAIRSAALRLGAIMTEIDERLEAFNRTWRWPDPRPLPPGTGLKSRDES